MLTSSPAAWRRHPLLTGILAGLAVVLAAKLLHIFVGTNFHAVVTGHCYRSGQPSGPELQTLSHALGVRRVINLRGENEQEEWYREEYEAADRLGMEVVDVGLSANWPPVTEEFRKLVRALDRGAEPMLLHCHSGSDRTGLAATVYLLLHTDLTPAQALGQLSPRFGHYPFGKAACQRGVIDEYADWLRAEELPHRPENFRRWALEVYVGEYPWPLVPVP